MRIVCDTNVLVSGFLFGGHCRTVIRLVSEGKAEGFISSILVAELEGVLRRRKFGLTARQVAGIIDLVNQTFVTVIPLESVAVVKDDPDDNAVLEAAIAAEADLVISGDSHLLGLVAFKGIRIIPPSSLADKFQRGK